MKYVIRPGVVILMVSSVITAVALNIVTTPVHEFGHVLIAWLTSSPILEVHYVGFTHLFGSYGYVIYQPSSQLPVVINFIWDIVTVILIAAVAILLGARFSRFFGS